MTQRELTDDQRYAIIRDKDRNWDGQFVFAVQTTGIYCRPSCGARTPLRHHVVFFDSGDAAKSAGFRACKRCKPDGQPASTVWIESVCRRLEDEVPAPTLESLAQRVGCTISTLQRTFKSVLGVSPRQYANAVRQRRFRDTLQRASSVTTAGYEAGYGSSGRLYEDADAALGMQPNHYRQFGAGERIEYACADSALGRVLVARTHRGVCAVFLGADDDTLVRDLDSRFQRATLVHSETLDEEVGSVLQALSTGQVDAQLPLDIRGTAFQHRVWQALRNIPVGQTRTYSELAAAIGAPRAVRAVGSACGANRLALLVPCHRAVREDGHLGGYRWGLERKRQLLNAERASSGLASSEPSASEPSASELDGPENDPDASITLPDTP